MALKAWAKKDSGRVNGNDADRGRWREGGDASPCQDASCAAISQEAEAIPVRMRAYVRGGGDMSG